jgi:hypothetical protein
MNLIQSATIGAHNALLLTGDYSYLDLPRQLLDRVYKQGQMQYEEWCIPHRHGDSGWYDYRLPDPAYPVYLWYYSMEAADKERAALWQSEIAATLTEVPDYRGKGDDVHTTHWFHFIQGHNPDYPEKILRVNYAEVCRRLEKMRHDDGNPEEWDVHHWQDVNPVVCEGLVQLMLGGPQTIYHGGLLNCRLRYFDPEEKRAGIPTDVAALVHHVGREGVEVDLVNLNPLRERRVLLQSGAFAEHRFTGVSSAQGESGLDGPHLEVALAPAAGGRIRLAMERYVGAPTYRFPWRRSPGR